MLFQRILVAAASLLGVAIAYGVLTAENDSEEIHRLQAALRRAPNLEYPRTDIQGRSIPQFDQLAVLPDCNSCSNFRTKLIDLAKANPKTRFLVLSPDIEKLDTFAFVPNCYVASFGRKSKFAEMPPGIYQK